MREELLRLQCSIASVDFIHNQSSGNGLGFLIYEKFPIQIRMEPDCNHKMPHIHITLGKLQHHASYSINDGSIIAGKSSRYDKDVTAWIAENHDKLIELWSTVQEGKPYEHLVEVIKQS